MALIDIQTAEVKSVAWKVKQQLRIEAEKDFPVEIGK